jgi:hypothetical protein
MPKPGRSHGQNAKQRIMVINPDRACHDCHLVSARDDQPWLLLMKELNHQLIN